MIDHGGILDIGFGTTGRSVQTTKKVPTKVSDVLYIHEAFYSDPTVDQQIVSANANGTGTKMKTTRSLSNGSLRVGACANVMTVMCLSMP